MVFLKLDTDIAYNRAKLESVLESECSYFSKEYDVKEYFEHGVLKKIEEDEVILTYYNNIIIL